LERYFASHGLAGHVDLCGFVPQEELVGLYRAADVCVVPSILYESFSYTCLQAMACGRPLVATTMGGMPEVVADDVTGLLVPPGQPGPLAAALERLICDAELRLRLGRAGRERAVRLYANHSVAQQNLAVYAEAIERRAHGLHGRRGSNVVVPAGRWPGKTSEV
jgi:glycosyltransferase involved in cell wall biosynthesis